MLYPFNATPLEVEEIRLLNDTIRRTGKHGQKWLFRVIEACLCIRELYLVYQQPSVAEESTKPLLTALSLL